MKQLWRCMSKTSGELLGSMEFKAPLKTQPPLQITTKISLPLFFSPRLVVAQGACFIWCSGKWSCVCSTSLQIRNVVLKRGTVRKKWTEKWVSWGTGTLEGVMLLLRLRQTDPGRVMPSTYHISSHKGKPAQWEVQSAKLWQNPNNERKCSFISVQQPSVLQAQSLATTETLIL